MQTRKQQGFVLVLVLLFSIMLFVLMTVMAAQSSSQAKSSQSTAGTADASNNARAALRIATSMLSGYLKTDDFNTQVVKTMRADQLWYYGPNNQNPSQDDVDLRLQNLKTNLQTDLDSMTCNTAALPEGGPNNEKLAQVRIYFTNTACGIEIPESINLPKGSLLRGPPNRGSTASVVQMYSLPYVIIAEGLTVGNIKQTYQVNGKINFEIGQGPFSRYQMYTSTLSRFPDNLPYYLNTWDVFNGPVYLGTLPFLKGKPWFGDVVTSAGCEINQTWCYNPKGYGHFYQPGGESNAAVGIHMKADEMTPSPQAPCLASGDCPVFTSGVNWTAPPVGMPSDYQSLSRISTAAIDGGVYYTRTGGATVDSITLRRGINEYNNPAQFMTICSSTPPTGGEIATLPTTSCLEFQTLPGRPQLYLRTGVGVDPFAGPGYQVYRSNFSKVVYVRGGISSVSSSNEFDPAIASWTQLTVAALDDLTISGNLRYELPPCDTDLQRSGDQVTLPDCPKLSANNVLGLYSKQGHIKISSAAPTTLTVMAAMMAQEKSIYAEDWNNAARTDLKEVRILGSVVQNKIGMFGNINPQTGVKTAGYNLRMMFDPRFSDTAGLTPPFWPVFTNNGLLSAVNLFDNSEKVDLD